VCTPQVKSTDVLYLRRRDRGECDDVDFGGDVDDDLALALQASVASSARSKEREKGFSGTLLAGI
jgi:hypothetical protein